MGKKAKKLRKGKKAWRTNISMEDIEDFYEKSTKDALSGGDISFAPSDSIFFLDKSRDLSVKRKIEKHREKVLHCESILQPNSFVQAITSSKQKSKKKQKTAVKANEVTQDGSKGDSLPAPDMVDLWENRDELNTNSRKVKKPTCIPAVEVEHPGCSYNPTFETHQDVLAEAVAQEMQKVYQDELGPQPVPLTVPGEVIDDEDRLFLDVDNGSDDDDTNMENLSENDDTESQKRSSKMKRVTRVELNRRARRKEQQKKEAEEKRVEDISKEIDSLPNILQEIANEDEEKHKRHLRRVTAKQERLKSCPPRLGKHKFQPAPVQVLLSEEITGSLRKLKGCCTLARDRFKSLEKRGLIVPTGKNRRK